MILLGGGFAGGRGLRAAAQAQEAPAASQAADSHDHAAMGHGEQASPRTLLGYVEQEQEFLEFLKKNHPIFSVYEKSGRLLGKPRVSDREEEFVEFGGAAAFVRAHDVTHAAITDRLGEESILDLPNTSVGPKKCGECHPEQYRKWEKSRHALNVRFPDEITEVRDLTGPAYPTAKS